MFVGIFGTLCCLLVTAYCCQEILGKESLSNNPSDYNTADFPRSTQIPIYIAMSEKVTFYEALQSCNSMGLELASILSEEEENSIEKYVMTQKPSYGAYDGYWIAGVRRSLNGTNDFAWITKGKPFEFQKHTEGRTLDNYGGKENCLEFVVDGPPTIFLWNDLNCDQQLNFICQTVTHF